MTSLEKHNRMANAIRFLSMDAVQKANSGHPGLPMGAADVATVLFTRFMRFDPKNPNWPNRDRFVLSAGHGSMLLYSLLYLLGYEDMTLEDLKNFRQLGSKTAGHPEYGHASGIETTTGPLGQGIANAVGMAIAERKLADEFGDALMDHYTYALCGDGCLMEGISQEAITLAGHLKLSKLILFWDNNSITIDGAVSLADSTDQHARFRAANWHTIDIDGHNPDEVAAAIEEAQKSDKPTMIACKTTIGYGAPKKAGTNKAHGSPLGDEEIAETRKALGWEYAPFELPEDILDAWRVAGLRSTKSRVEWEERLEGTKAEIKAEFNRRFSGALPGSFDRTVQKYKQKLADEKPTLASRKSSQNALEVINGAIPETIGGSADLTGSNNTNTSQTPSITPDDFSGRFIHWGIREHAMAAAMNGIALHGGLIPYSGGFLIFSDYCRTSVRLAALMGIRVIHVWTHDSIGVGEDGPTHEPVEQMASLRAIPNLLMFRPADAMETAECWQLALESQHAPSGIALTRQNLPAVRLDYSEKNLCATGAYDLIPANEAEVTIFASGSEVGLAVEAQKVLDGKGIATRVVSVPCMELFFEQPEDYQKAIIGNSPIKVGVEAAIRMGWDAFIGTDGIFIGMNGYGASGKGSDLFKHFGITAEAIVEAVEKKRA
ncbi:transketolase [Martelella sp. AD-3]|uniref:transketolase n=2 Tax=Martelella sp. AD-3 TaxID=686597 RepID=UPI00077797A7|nr:transketolase [Martelella sp. AD-3]AMM85451.1 transketolase [Martelella sp. AD-3]MAM13737.1 transketolase [Rhizobiaceae bacterium]